MIFAIIVTMAFLFLGMFAISQSISEAQTEHAFFDVIISFTNQMFTVQGILIVFISGILVLLSLLIMPRG